MLPKACLKIEILLFFSLFIWTSSCNTTRILTRKDHKALSEQLMESPVFSDIFTGFALYDPKEKVFLFQKDADKYYTPASNTKIFTLYTSLNVLGDSIPVLRYADKGGSRILQGTGSPLLLHPDFAADSMVLSFLQNSPGRLLFSSDNYQGERFGPGWSWADYAYSYQLEISSLPLYGNMVRIKPGGQESGFQVFPPFFERYFRFDPALDNHNYAEVRRAEHRNVFYFNTLLKEGQFSEQAIGFYQAQHLIPDLLSATVQRPVNAYVLIPEDEKLTFRTISIPLTDTLFRRFMHPSDNFIGEQLLLTCSARLFDGELSTAKVIDYAKKNLLADLPDEPRWVDGSGLSRYNLFTPRSVVRLLEKLLQEVPEERLLAMLPAGGVRGTIQSWYPGENGVPYVFAKTGTLSNKHCLSGYLKTKSGKILIFSFMHNNYLGSSSPVKKEMQQVLEWMRDHL